MVSLYLHKYAKMVNYLYELERAILLDTIINDMP